MPERAAVPNTAAPQPEKQPFCSTCCAKLELGSLFCGICLKNKLLRLAAEGLESEITELPAPVN
ncbi:MAG: hypothetical protein ACTFAL_10550 [Candidatus Electronema sp. V4]|uniref:hypothetical protein n=1 Tax=Candidatus Electronema sp. V4 TaxID=3454756 RepID=UPI004055495C